MFCIGASCHIYRIYIYSYDMSHAMPILVSQLQLVFTCKRLLIWLKNAIIFLSLSFFCFSFHILFKVLAGFSNTAKLLKFTFSIFVFLISFFYKYTESMRVCLCVLLFIWFSSSVVIIYCLTIQMFLVHNFVSFSFHFKLNRRWMKLFVSFFIST